MRESKKLKKKKERKKEDKQAFGVIAAKPTDLHEAFSYRITSLPLSIASPDSNLFQSGKAGFPPLHRLQSVSLMGWQQSIL